MRILVTGAAGFIGNELALRLAARGDEVTGIDNPHDYYDVCLKQVRLDRLRDEPKLNFIKLVIADRKAMAILFGDHGFNVVVNLAARQAPYRIYIIGNNNSVQLLEFIRALEKRIGKKAELNMLPMQQGDMKATCANVDALSEMVGFSPSTSINLGARCENA